MVQTVGRVTFQYISTCLTCGSVVQTACRVILVYISTCRTSGSVYLSTVLVSAALCVAGVCLCFFLLLNVVYLPIYAKLRLVVGMTKQMSNGKEIDVVNC